MISNMENKSHETNKFSSCCISHKDVVERSEPVNHATAICEGQGFKKRDVSHGRRKDFFQGGGSRGFSQNFFQGEAKSGEICFLPLEIEKVTFFC